MPEKPKKVFDVVHPPALGASVLQIENRKRVVFDDVQDKNTIPSSSTNVQQSNVRPIEADTLQPVNAEPVNSENAVTESEVSSVSEAVTDHDLVQQETADLIPSPEPEVAPEKSIPDTPPQENEIDTEKPEAKQSEQHLTTPGSVSDAIPDVSQKLSLEAEANMQQPKAFDTNEYFVPIGETTHKHGHLKESLIFGSLLAVAVVVAIVYLLA